MSKELLRECRALLNELGDAANPKHIELARKIDSSLDRQDARGLHVPENNDDCHGHPGITRCSNCGAVYGTDAWNKVCRNAQGRELNAVPQVPHGVCRADDPNSEAQLASGGNGSAVLPVASRERGDALSVSHDGHGTETPAGTAPDRFEREGWSSGKTKPVGIGAPAGTAPSPREEARRGVVEEPWAWAVHQPKGAEFDYLVYPHLDHAQRDHAVVDGDEQPIPLYPLRERERAPVEAAGGEEPDEPFVYLRRAYPGEMPEGYSRHHEFEMVLKSEYDKLRSALRGSYEVCARICEEIATNPVGDSFEQRVSYNHAAFACHDAIRAAAMRERGKHE